MADEGLRGRLAKQGEDALGKLAQDLLENPLVNGALTRAFEAREKATQAQEAALGALNIPSAADVERLTRRLRSVSQRLEGIEDGVDRLDQRLADLKADGANPLAAVEERLGAIEGHAQQARRRRRPRRGRLRRRAGDGAARAGAARRRQAGDQGAQAAHQEVRFVLSPRRRARRGPRGPARPRRARAPPCPIRVPSATTSDTVEHHRGGDAVPGADREQRGRLHLDGERARVRPAARPRGIADRRRGRRRRPGRSRPPAPPP